MVQRRLLAVSLVCAVGQCVGRVQRVLVDLPQLEVQLLVAVAATRDLVRVLGRRALRRQRGVMCWVRALPRPAWEERNT